MSIWGCFNSSDSRSQQSSTVSEGRVQLVVPRDVSPKCLRLAGWLRRLTVSRSQLPDVVRYVERQREHHRLQAFQEEYRALLDRHGIDYDERYLWG